MTKQPPSTSEMIYELWHLQGKVDALLAQDDDEVTDCAGVFTRTGIDLHWSNRIKDEDGTELVATPQVLENSVADLYRAVANQPITPSAELFVAGVEVLMQETYSKEQKTCRA